ncbi:MAG: UDP-N-acetylmuramoyl-L-alanyl-D-glutamate--2,6-diaminopimelate ligase [Legionellaceae bacterium]
MQEQKGKALNELLFLLNIPPVTKDLSIQGIALDSRLVKPAYLFIACPGSKVDGRTFIQEAINKGASAILVDANDYLPVETSIPIILVDKLQQKISLLANHFYGQPSKKIKVFGITGTNGKTSCSQFIARTLSAMNKPCGVIGTLGFGFPEQLTLHSMTTPDAVRTQQLLAEMKKQGASAVAMEVSSHALVQGRVNNIHFHTAIFTNLTRDHLDYHGSIENYGQAKQRLFDFPDLKNAIINSDDPFGVALINRLGLKLPIIAYSIKNDFEKKNNVESVTARDISYSPQGIKAWIETPWGAGELKTSLLGEFNLSNLLATISALGLEGFSFPEILKQISYLQGVPGRMETLGGNQKPLVVIDYAHTPDALKQALIALRSHCQGQLWCVFGCGGDRDKGKRSLMGYAAEEYADHIILTDDNPRHEEAKKIINDIMQGINPMASVIIEHDRRRAINHALSCAKPNDIVLIAGKGHETYQQIGDDFLSFSDKVEVMQILSE